MTADQIRGMFERKHPVPRYVEYRHGRYLAQEPYLYGSDYYADQHTLLWKGYRSCAEDFAKETVNT